MKRKTGFYWCDTGIQTGWKVCYFNSKKKVWYISLSSDIIPQHMEMEYFETIDETRLTHKK